VEHAIRGFHGVTLLLTNAAKTGGILSNVSSEGGWTRGSVIRYRAPQLSPGSIVDIYEAKGFLPGHQGRGSVHHIAFRAADDAEQTEMHASSWKSTDFVHRAARPQLFPLDLFP